MSTASYKRYRLVIVFVMLVSLLIQGDWLWQSPSIEKSQHPESPRRDSIRQDKIPLPVQYAFSSDLGSMDRGYHFTTVGKDSYITANRRTGVSASIKPTSLQVSTGVESWSISLRTWGRGRTNVEEDLLTLESSQPSGRGRIGVGKYPFASTDNRLEYRMPGLTSWYVNGPLGLQQGWTISKAPSGIKGEPLTLVLALDGSLWTLVERGGRSLALLDSLGMEILRYGGLVAYDATGRELKAEFVLNAASLLVQVDDAEAVYPLTIDPWLQLAKLTTGNGSLGDSLGFSSAMSGDGTTVVLGAILDGGVGVDRGALFVYEKIEENFRGTKLYNAKLTASDGGYDDGLGFSIAIDEYNDTIVAGVPDHDGVASDAGAVYLFERPVYSASWKDATQTAKLVDPLGVVSDHLGYSVAISLDGSWVAAGAPGFDIDVHSNVGKVCIFKEPVGGWAGTINPTAYITANGYQDGDMFGRSVALDGSLNTLVVGAPAIGVGGDDKGSLFVYQCPAGDWVSTSAYAARLFDQNAQAGDTLGRVVTISGDGSMIAAGMWDLNDPGTNRGAVYVYVKPSTGWVTTGSITAVLSAFDGADNDCLGSSVATDWDGDTIAAGAPYNDTGGTDRGVVLIYERPTVGGWQNTSFYNARLTNNETSTIKGLGYSLGTNMNGDSLVVGAPNFEGRAYVYKRTGSEWTDTAYDDMKLIHADGRQDDYLGFSVASGISIPVLALGAPQYDISTSTSNEGAVFLYWIDPGSPSPNSYQKLYAWDGEAGDNFGYSVAVSANGLIYSSGAPNRDGDGSNRGAVYVFDYTASTSALLVASDAEDGDWLGWSVAISGDGNTIVAGAPARDGEGSDRGAIYVWVKYDPAWSTATETAIITPSDGVDGDQLGYAVSVNYDGSFIAAGAPFHTISTLSPGASSPTASYSDAGVAYIYTRPAGGWTSTSTFTAKKTASDPTTDANLGYALALSPDGSTLGAVSNHSGGVDRGAVYVFEKGTAWVSGSEAAKLSSSDSDDGDRLGFSVAVDYDGSTIAAGSVNHAAGGVQRGAVYVYDRPNLGWMYTATPTKKLTASDGIDWDHLGYSVAMDYSGRFILSGAPNADVQDWDRGAGYYWWNPFNQYLPLVKK